MVETAVQVNNASDYYKYLFHFQNFERATSFAVDDVDVLPSAAGVDELVGGVAVAMMETRLDAANGTQTHVLIVPYRFLCLYLRFWIFEQNLEHELLDHNSMDHLKKKMNKKYLID